MRAICVLSDGATSYFREGKRPINILFRGRMRRIAQLTYSQSLEATRKVVIANYTILLTGVSAINLAAFRQ